jgi:hypothetical protein
VYHRQEARVVAVNKFQFNHCSDEANLY